MTDKQSYWLVNEAGTKALAVGASERDRWTPLGWAETTEPVGNEFLYARKEGVTDPGMFPAAAFLETWAPRGWEPCAPPDFAGQDSGPVTPVQTPEPVAKSATKEK